ncbi:hypothetical protein PHYC_02592 [Phycisphaerales bacterium]|nr:hypothetical protein PHYC_02592 [Phycisphaerales bacterium]
MSLSLPWSQRTPIGVDIAGRTIKAVQCAVKRGAPPRMIACVQASRPGQPARSPLPSAEDAALIAGIIERGGFEGAGVILGIPRDLTMSAALELPPRSSGAPLEQIARLELARANRADPSAFEMALWEVPPPLRAGDGTHAIAVGLLPVHVEPLLDALECLGLEVLALDCRAPALHRAAAPLLARDGLTCLVDANWDGLSVIVSLRDCIVVERFVESVGWAGVCSNAERRAGLGPDALAGVLTRVAACEESLSPRMRTVLGEYVDSVVPEVARSVSYATHRYPETPIRRVLVTGDGWAAPGLFERLGASLSAPAQPLLLSHVATLPRVGHTQSPDVSCAVALGLALHGSRALMRSAA